MTESLFVTVTAAAGKHSAKAEGFAGWLSETDSSLEAETEDPPANFG